MAFFAPGWFLWLISLPGNGHPGEAGCGCIPIQDLNNKGMSEQDDANSESDAKTPPGEATAFHSFQERLGRGDSLAAQELFEKYSLRLAHIAGKNIHPALLKRFDGEDVVQSVFRTFFRRHEAGKLQIERSDQLWRLLVTITLCKTRSHARRHTADRRNIRAEEGVGFELDMLQQKPTDESAVALWEEVEAALEGLPDRTVDILSSRLAGKTKMEIAKEFGLSRQTIHRVLKLVEQRLIARFEQFSDPE